MSNQFLGIFKWGYVLEKNIYFKTSKRIVIIKLFWQRNKYSEVLKHVAFNMEYEFQNENFLNTRTWIQIKVMKYFLLKK